MPTEKIAQSAIAIDLSPRFATTVTVAGSPAAAAETIVASLAIPFSTTPTLISGVILNAWAAFTVGTSGTAVTMRIRQTGLAGTVIVTTGAITGGIAATNLVTLDAGGFDTNTTAPTAIYVCTLQVTAGAAASTVSAVWLTAQLV